MHHRAAKHDTGKWSPARLLSDFFTAFFIFLLLSPPLLAADQKAQATTPLAVNPIGANQLASVTLGLLLVLALIFGLAWLFRRYGNLATLNRSNIQVLGGVSLGPREKAILLEVEGERLLVGVASGHVSKLHVFSGSSSDLKENADVDSNEPVGQGKEIFADTLEQVKNSSGTSA